MIHVGDCLEIMRTLPDNSVDSVVTDPPYGLSREPDMAEVLRHWLAGDDYVHRSRGFMGKAWDSFVPGPAVWRECLRVLKPGGHLLAFAGTRTHDLMTLGLRIAGFEIRDTIMWVYGSGFPKSLDVSKAIDRAAGVVREVPGRHARRDSDVAIAGPDGRCRACGRGRGGQPGNCQCEKRGQPVTDAAVQWDGWGTALKPALEPITVARKPLDGTVAANVLAHGTGALNIDGCRIGAREPRALNRNVSIGFGGSDPQGAVIDGGAGRWPANLAHDGSDEVLARFPHTTTGAVAADTENSWDGDFLHGLGSHTRARPSDRGSAARFFYCAKAGREDRNAGLEGMPMRMTRAPNGAENAVGAGRGSLSRPRENSHPTVKPTDLMRWLCRLVTPPGGLVLDPFAGSGSTGRGALAEGFGFIGIELDPDYAEIARRRIEPLRYGQRTDMFRDARQ